MIPNHFITVSIVPTQRGEKIPNYFITVSLGPTQWGEKIANNFITVSLGPSQWGEKIPNFFIQYRLPHRGEKYTLSQTIVFEQQATLKFGNFGGKFFQVID